MKTWKRWLGTLLASVMTLTSMTFTAPLQIVQADPGQEEQAAGQELVNLDTVWKYLDDNTDPSVDGNRTAWTEEGFDDSAWKSNEGSMAQFGAKNGAIGDLGDGITPAVLLNQYINGESGDDIPAFFFRTTFTLDAIPEDMEL